MASINGCASSGERFLTVLLSEMVVVNNEIRSGSAISGLVSCLQAGEFGRSVIQPCDVPRSVMEPPDASLVTLPSTSSPLSAESPA